MWMSGPEWGWLAIDDQAEIKGATDNILWSEDSQFVAFIRLHVEAVPNRQGAEGMSFRVGVVRMSDKNIRYCLGNKKLAEVKLKSVTSESISVFTNGEQKSFDLSSIDWASKDAL